MNPRENFLRRVFTLLDECGVAYCVQRNFDSIFIDGATDVDLLALDVCAVREACAQAASEAGFVLAHAARYVNHSWVFAHEAGTLVRIDVDTAVRWRWHHVLSAAEVLAARVRSGNFFIPAPRHEAAILRAQIAWRGEASSRYARRLAELGAPAVNVTQTRRSIALHSLAHPFAVLGYVAADTARCLARCFGALAGKSAPGGASLVLAGLDGVGKTTFARVLLIESARTRRFAGVRYFHWIPSPFRRAEFPWPAEGDRPRRLPERGALATALSAARLARSVVLAWLGFAVVVHPLVRRGWLVIIDRYVTNYWLDPASVRFAGPAHWLAWAQRLFPKADALLALDADAATIRTRKAELDETEIARQSELLRQLPALAARRIDLDAAQPVETLVAQTFTTFGGHE